VPDVWRRVAQFVPVALLAAVPAGPAASGVRVIGGTAIQVQSAPWSVLVYVSDPRTGTPPTTLPCSRLQLHSI